MQVFVRLHEDDARGGVVGKAVLKQQVNEVCHEEDYERHGRTEETYTAARTDILVVDIVHHIKDAQRASKENHGKAEDEHPRVEQGIKTMRGISPMTDDWSERCAVDEVLLFYNKVAAFKKSSYGAAEEQRAKYAV